MSEEKVAEVVEKLEFLERSGIAPHVAEGGQFTAVVIGTSQFDALGIPEPEEPVDFGKAAGRRRTAPDAPCRGRAQGSNRRFQAF